MNSFLHRCFFYMWAGQMFLRRKNRPTLRQRSVSCSKIWPSLWSSRGRKFRSAKCTMTRGAIWLCRWSLPAARTSLKCVFTSTTGSWEATAAPRYWKTPILYKFFKINWPVFSLRFVIHLSEVFIRMRFDYQIIAHTGEQLSRWRIWFAEFPAPRRSESTWLKKIATFSRKNVNNSCIFYNAFSL